LSSPPASPDNRFLAIRAAAQDATEFSMPDGAVRRFIELRDAGADAARIAAAMELEPATVAELISADDAHALAHRIAIGEEPWYPAPPPERQVADTRAGSSRVPVLALVLLLATTGVYLLLR
jgi:hypothetical protein